MRKNLLKITYLSLLTTFAVISGWGVVFANTNEFLVKNSSELSLENTVEERKDLEKLINNVKVFYNPISEQINISFKLSKTSNVSIKVMDALGNEVLQLMNANVENGTQALAFEHGGKLAPGFYFVRVVAGSETIVKRFSVR